MTLSKSLLIPDPSAYSIYECVNRLFALGPFLFIGLLAAIIARWPIWTWDADQREWVGRILGFVLLVTWSVPWVQGILEMVYDFVH